MTATVEMRTLHGDVSPLEFEQARNPYMVRVPGFGVLIVAHRPHLVDEPWGALLIQPDNMGGFSPASNRVPFDDVKVVDDALEVELLPNRSGEDRLVVVLRPTEPVA